VPIGKGCVRTGPDLIDARDFVNAREKVVAVTMGSPVIDEESKKQRANATPA
jgi:hypothetical protein